MSQSSSLHSFAFFAFLLIFFSSLPGVLSVDAGKPLRKRKCSGILPSGISASVSGTGLGTASATGSIFGNPGTNATALASSLAYSRTQSPSNNGGNESPVSATLGNCPSPVTVTITNAVTVTVTAGSGGGGSVEAGSSDIGSGAGPTGGTGSGSGTGSSTGSGVPGGPGITVPSMSGTAGLPSPSGNGSSSSPFPVNNSTTGSSSPTNSSTVAPSSNATTNTNANFHGQFWAGADFGTLMRMEALPGRVFYDFDGTTVKDPVKTLGDAGVNAVRIEGQRGQCLGPTKFDNSGNVVSEELLFTLDWGCLDIQVKTAQRAVAQGMRVVLTINQGFKIPKELESLSYAAMADNVGNEAKRQLQPFLDAKIVPDVILLENEGSDGFLFIEETTNHVRGLKDGKVSDDVVDKELCAQIPTGNMASYPQYAGYLKAEILACNAAIAASGLPTDTVRYGLHSHGQYVQWKEYVVHGPSQASQTDLVDSSRSHCSTDPIPANLLSQNVSTMLTIAGFSAYPDPMTPTNINDPASQASTLDRLEKTLTQLQGYAESYGKYTDGPFAGQYKLQGLGVEYATSFEDSQIPQEQALTALMWKTVKGFEAFLGMLWYEPWYCYSDWAGGKAALCKHMGKNGEAPTDTLKTWGAGAVSPWKK